MIIMSEKKIISIKKKLNFFQKQLKKKIIKNFIKHKSKLSYRIFIKYLKKDVSS